MQTVIVNGFIIQKDGLKVTMLPGTMVLYDGKNRNHSDEWKEINEDSAQWRFNNFQKYAAAQPSAVGTNIHIDKMRAKLEGDEHFLKTYGNRGHVCNDGTYKIF